MNRLNNLTSLNLLIWWENVSQNVNNWPLGNKEFSVLLKSELVTHAFFVIDLKIVIENLKTNS